MKAEQWVEWEFAGETDHKSYVTRPEYEPNSPRYKAINQADHSDGAV
jgi:hypothetical protein